MSRMWLGAAVLTLLTSCAVSGGESLQDDASDRAWELDGKIPVGLTERLDSGETVTVIVAMRENDLQPSWRGRSRVARRQLKRGAYVQRTETILSALPQGAFIERKRYNNLPVVALDLTRSEAALALAADPLVQRVFEETAHEHMLDASLPLIEQPAVESMGHDGEGVTVAVLDTGADYTRAAFGSCSSPGGNCSVVHAEDFAPEDGARDKGSYHGTNVAAIVLGVAPAAQIAALDVFRNNGLAYSSEILAAIDWVIANADTYNIKAMNLSLGGGAFSSTCDSTSPYTSAIDNARDQGILAAIASGNDAQKNKTAEPACVSSAVTVGAQYTQSYGAIGWSSCSESATAAEQVTCFSNSADHLDILAPGALIVAGDLTMGGTSQAAPHVAGAIAVLAGADPDATADELESWLLAGPDHTDHRQGRTTPSLSLLDSINAAGIGSDTGDTQDTDTGDTGFASLNDWWVGEDDGYANSRKVQVYFDPAPGYDTEACLSNEPVCDEKNYKKFPKPGKARKWSLEKGDGDKVLYAWFRGDSGTEGPLVRRLTLDTEEPTDGTLSSSASQGTIELSWSGFDDEGTGLKEYVVLTDSRGREPKKGCGRGTEAYRGSNTSLSLTGLEDGTTYGIRVCALDAAGNASDGLTVTERPAPEYVPPIGSISINSGAEGTNDTRVMVTLSASDPAGVSAYCLSTKSGEDGCTKFKTMRGEVKAKLKKGSEDRTVWVWFMDGYGNVSVEPVSDTIFVDTEGPEGGQLVAAPSGSSLGLSWSGFSDDSGIDSYVLVASDSKSPKKGCQKNAVVYEGSAESTVHSGLNSGTLYHYRVCAVDGLGNLADGATFSAIAP